MVPEWLQNRKRNNTKQVEIRVSKRNDNLIRSFILLALRPSQLVFSLNVNTRSLALQNDNLSECISSLEVNTCALKYRNFLQGEFLFRELELLIVEKEVLATSKNTRRTSQVIPVRVRALDDTITHTTVPTKQPTTTDVVPVDLSQRSQRRNLSTR